MLWMTQPAWPSTEWQIFSHDYDTHAAFYGVKIASEPIHIQLDLPNYEIAIINNTTAALPQLSVHAQVFDLSSKLLFERSAAIDAAANSATTSLRLALEDALTDQPRRLREAHSFRCNWQAALAELLLARRARLRLPQAERHARGHPASLGSLETVGYEQHITITLTNPSQTTALTTKLTLLESANGQRILPAYYSDNYISLLPNEQRTIDIIYPSSPAHTHPVVALRGWNITPATIDVSKP